MLNIKSFPVILLHWVCLISWMCVRVCVCFWTVVCLDPKRVCMSEWWLVAASGCEVMLDQLFPLHFLLPSLTLCSFCLPVEAHDGDDRIPRLSAQTWANRSRIRGESWASYFTLHCLVILTHTQAASCTLCEWILHFRIPFSLCLQNEFPLDIALHSEWLCSK